MIKVTEHDYLNAAALAVERQATEDPELGIPVDPDVAEFMGAFEEEAVSLAEVLDSFAAAEE